MEFLLSAVSSRMPSGGREVRLGRIFGSIEDSKLCFLASSTVRAVIYQTASKTKAQCEVGLFEKFFLSSVAFAAGFNRQYRERKVLSRVVSKSYFILDWGKSKREGCVFLSSADETLFMYFPYSITWTIQKHVS